MNFPSGSATTLGPEHMETKNKPCWEERLKGTEKSQESTEVEQDKPYVR